MESRRPQKNQETGGLPDGQAPRPRRFRIVKLEERIAPKKGHFKNTKACASLDCTIDCVSEWCW
jgi:hypothetical protein